MLRSMMASGDYQLYFVKVLETLWQKRMLRKDVIYFYLFFYYLYLRPFFVSWRKWMSKD